MQCAGSASLGAYAQLNGTARGNAGTGNFRRSLIAQQARAGSVCPPL
jgi:hypothetical protein